MRAKILATFAVAAFCHTGQAQAAVGTVEFAGTILTSCTIALGGAGVLDVSGGGQVLSTRGGLGTPALATVVATGANFRVGVSSPTAFLIAPPDGNTGVTFETRYSASGLTSATDVLSGVTTLLNAGLTTLSVNLTARRALGFPAGAYTAQSTITCE